MKLLEMKNKLALDTAKIIFQNNIDVIFIGGTALNAFYLDYRYSEDLDLGYTKENKKQDLEKLLKTNGYSVSNTDFKHRDIITLEGISIKMDIIEYKNKLNGFEEKNIGKTFVKTLSLDEFIIDKTISFFTRENLAGMSRDGYDLFSIGKKYGTVLTLAKKEKNTIKKNIVTLNHNIDLFENNSEKVETAVSPYLKVAIDSSDVLEFLKKLQGVLK
jgi:predicted nucleotidyltransferase component of viral defense system